MHSSVLFHSGMSDLAPGQRVFIRTESLPRGPQPCDVKITFAEARRTSGEDLASPRVAVFLQHADLAALCRLLNWTAGAGTQLEAASRSMHYPQGTVHPTADSNAGSTPSSYVESCGHCCINRRQNTHGHKCSR